VDSKTPGKRIRGVGRRVCLRLGPRECRATWLFRKDSARAQRLKVPTFGGLVSNSSFCTLRDVRLAASSFIVLSVQSILVIGWVGPARSAGLTRPDGNDARGPLDLASVRVEHSSKQDAIQIRALGRVSSTELDGSTGWFEIDMSTDSDRAYERWIVVFYNGS